VTRGVGNYLTREPLRLEKSVTVYTRPDQNHLRSQLSRVRFKPNSARGRWIHDKARRHVPLRQVQEWLGHESIATTQIYVHLSRQNSQKVMEQTRL
jgi:site-specific recombinase XerC